MLQLGKDPLHVIGPCLSFGRGGGCDVKYRFFHCVSGEEAACGPTGWSGEENGAEVYSGRQHKAVIVIGVIPEHFYPARRVRRNGVAALKMVRELPGRLIV
jgi:hypothetical protein